MRKVLVGAVAAVVVAGGGVGAVVLSQDDAEPPLPLVSEPTPYPQRSALVGAAPDGAAPTRAGLQRAVGASLHDRRLGRSVSLSVVDVSSGRVLLDVSGSRAVTPASTAKIATAAAVLAVLPRDQRLTTRVVQGRPGELVLVGGGDPTLVGKAAAKGAKGPRLAELARQVQAWQRTATAPVTRLLVDDALFTGPRLGPGWKQSYVQDGDVAPVSALEVDGGRVSPEDSSARAADPALEAGRQLARLLRVRKVVRGTAPAGAAVVAHVSSEPVSALVERMLTRSDNDLAEALGRHLALATHRPASFTGESAAISAALREHGIEVALRDASGLSRQDRVRPAELAALLAAAARDGRYAPLLTGLPVAGFDGTLSERYRKTATRSAAGEVRAKTGTLDGVSALAGYVRTRNGRL
ncbi:MAG TPA: D-alanyl-D-alanine carboxypeptidase/D-alanyl-D-alanine-endopeptidase, partial [Mycobacteriales bacterium]|nr:D-alanyl-D-alanine carboxypeptidase/D-alanyl-D-alanine-endopeptidase [Mycobacteriales bacterium]